MTELPENPAKPRGRRILRSALRILLYLGIGVLIVGCVGFIFRDRIHMYGSGLLPDIDLSSKEARYGRLEQAHTGKAQEKTAAPADLASLASLPSWPEYRGANRDGISTESNLLAEWSKDGPPQIYRQPIGGGWSSFAIALGRAYTLEQRRDQEAVTCYDFDQGTELWAFSYKADFIEQMGGEGPRSTPTIDGDRVYALGAEGHLHCLNALTGELIWKANILQETGAGNLHWAMSGSPLILDGRLYVTASGEEGKDSLLCYDKIAGKLLWKNLKIKQSYASLIAVDLLGKKQMLDFSADAINGIEIADGSLLWSFPWEMFNDINASQPIVIGTDKVFVSSGYGKGCAMIELKQDAGGKFSASKLWDNLNMKNKFAPAILLDGFIYGLDEGILTCLDPQTGKRKWKGGHYGHGQMIYADKNLIVLGEEGQLALVKATPDKFTEIAKFDALNSKTWNVPALAGGRLLIRNDREMVCYDLRRKP